VSSSRHETPPGKNRFPKFRPEAQKIRSQRHLTHECASEKVFGGELIDERGSEQLSRRGFIDERGSEQVSRRGFIDERGSEQFSRRGFIEECGSEQFSRRELIDECGSETFFGGVLMRCCRCALLFDSPSGVRQNCLTMKTATVRDLRNEFPVWQRGFT
jgi:hypothetical protein